MYSSTLPSTSALDGGWWSTPRPGCFTPGKDPVSIVQEAGWAPGPVWTGAEKLVPTGIRSPDRPAGSESLYRLSYPAPSPPSGTKVNQSWSCTFFSFVLYSKQLYVRLYGVTRQDY